MNENLLITHPEILHLLKAYVSVQGSQKFAAKSLGVSEQFLSDVLRCKREVSEKLASKLGYRRSVRFRKK